ncbi:unnamed protein product [Leuciscus chuanchicus]
MSIAATDGELDSGQLGWAASWESSVARARSTNVNYAETGHRDGQACKFSSVLTGKAYRACWQAASSLHVMALLQVHQAKALMDMHECSPDQELMGELCNTTDCTLQGINVVACGVVLANSTLGDQERHLLLNLADMRETNKSRFLDSPISQVGLFGNTVENFAQQFSATQKQMEAIQHILPRRPAAASTRLPVADPPPARHRGRPPAAASAPARPQQQPASRPQCGDGRRQAAQSVARPGGKRKHKRP